MTTERARLLLDAPAYRRDPACRMAWYGKQDSLPSVKHRYSDPRGWVAADEPLVDLLARPPESLTLEGSPPESHAHPVSIPLVKRAATMATALPW